MKTPDIVLRTAEADARVYRHGAHVAHFQPRGQRPVLWMSRQSWFEPGKPIRGGVPIIFPWFGPKEGAPSHGLVRQREWELEATEPVLILRTEEAGCRLRYRVELGAALKMTLEVENISPSPVQFEEALHTYFAVSDVRQVSVTGLEDTEYLDSLENFARKRQGNEPVRFTGETDRTYLNTRATCVLHDPAWQRRIIVEKTGSDATVVWNPWIAKAHRMPDFGDDEWPGMVCIETCNCGPHAVTLAAGAKHVMSQTVRVG